MKYTLDQLELIAIMFKIQFGDKTFKDIFPKLKYTKHEGTINELNIDHDDGDINFTVDRLIVAYFCPIRSRLSIINNEVYTKSYSTKTENIIKMLNFEDKI